MSYNVIYMMSYDHQCHVLWYSYNNKLLNNIMIISCAALKCYFKYHLICYHFKMLFDILFKCHFKYHSKCIGISLIQI